jgi:hypothetical protein
MKYILPVTILIIIYSTFNQLCAQVKKTDTTLKIGKAGYRIICNNKDAERNEMDIKPIGFDKDAHESILFVKGRINRSEIDDLNNDGFPDLMIYTVSGPRGQYGNAYAIVSLANKSFTPVGLPDVELDAKYRDGYRGYDEFTLLEGTLMRKFPIYKSDDKDKPTGGRRVIQYQMTGTENTGFKFKVLHSFDTQ